MACRSHPRAKTYRQSTCGGCTTLTLDRHNRRTTAAPCLGPGQWLRDALTAQLVKPALP